MSSYNTDSSYEFIGDRFVVYNNDNNDNEYSMIIESDLNLETLNESEDCICISDVCSESEISDESAADKLSASNLCASDKLSTSNLCASDKLSASNLCASDNLSVSDSLSATNQPSASDKPSDKLSASDKFSTSEESSATASDKLSSVSSHTASTSSELLSYEPVDLSLKKCCKKVVDDGEVSKPVQAIVLHTVPKCRRQAKKSRDEMPLNLSLDSAPVDILGPTSENEGNNSSQKRKRQKFDTSVEERKRQKFMIKRGFRFVKSACMQIPNDNVPKSESQKGCVKNCLINIDEERRIAINDYFWDMPTDENRRNFIFNSCEKHEVGRRTTIILADKEKTRQHTYKYFFKNAEGEKFEVCRKFFLTTLGYHEKNDRFLRTCLLTPTDKLLVDKSQRGRRASTNKGPREEIKNHIESFNPTIAHYRREHAPNRRYLPSDMSITSMHANFIDTYPQFKETSYELYRLVLNEMKISFAHLGHEECEMCEKFQLHEHSEDTLDENCEICMEWKVHIENAKASRALYQKFAEKSDDDDSVVFSADMEKVIMLRRMEMFKQIIFAPRLTAFNLTFAPLGKKSVNRPFAALWHSAIKGRKKEEIVSGFNAFFQKYSDRKKIIVWLDNCSAQNKNWCLLTFLIKAVDSPELAVEEVSFYYFDPGHTFMSADSFHHQVELSLKMQAITYNFQDFVDAVQEANRGRVHVKSMEVSDFYEWKDLKSGKKLKSDKNFDSERAKKVLDCDKNVESERALACDKNSDSVRIEKLVCDKDSESERVYLRDIVHLKVVRGEKVLYYKTSYDAPEYKTLDFLQVRYMKNIPDPKACETPIGFAKDRKEKLLHVLKGLIREPKMKFWLDLPTPLAASTNSSAKK